MALHERSPDQCAQITKKCEGMEREQWLPKAKLLLHLTNETHAELQLESCPRQILYADDSVFIRDNKQVLRLNEEGTLVKRYFPKNPGSNYVQGMGVFGDSLYIHTYNEITKLPLGDQKSDEPVAYKPDAQEIWNIYVADRNKIIFTDCQTKHFVGGKSPGKISQYNPETNSTEVLVDNLKGPTYISFANTAEGPRYIVTMSDGSSLRVYDSSWKQLAVIGSYGCEDGQVRGPQETAITEAGTVLVADCFNHRVCEFAMDGAFLGTVLSMKDGIYEPYGLAYSRPYLWVTQGYTKNSAAVKCVQIAEN